jgi:RimJ/RimL family protein N-acetyltransferase
MKTRKIIVPRSIIKKHFPHPEFFGESIVELANGMATDVYTDLDGSLFTKTNNEYLTHYLLSNQIVDKPMLMKSDHLLLKSISVQDANQIHEWFLISPFRRAQSVENEIDIVYEYISHAKTIYSDVLMISSKDIPVGLIGYSIIDNIGILSYEVYNHSIITINEAIHFLEQIKNHLLLEFNLHRLVIHVFEYDHFIQAILDQTSFRKNEDKVFLIPTLNGFMQQVEYVYEVENI